MVDVPAELILRPLGVFLHPPLNSFPCVVRASTSDAAAAVRVHASHKHRLKYLDKRMMDVLVRPLRRLIYLSPLLSTGVPAPRVLRRLLLEAVHDDAAKFLNPLGFRFLDPGRAAVGTMMRSPVVGAVHFVDGESQIFI